MKPGAHVVEVPLGFLQQKRSARLILKTTRIRVFKSRPWQFQSPSRVAQRPGGRQIEAALEDKAQTSYKHKLQPMNMVLN